MQIERVVPRTYEIPLEEPFVIPLEPTPELERMAKAEGGRP
ncbi:hypothetical protein [Haladaptatus salinisoli]|nr:hypothetical protein [Haladaptatus salinisoli]